jgi:hypothetical protein
LRDLERRQRVGRRALQDAQYVVLLHRDPVRLDSLREASAHHVRGPEEGDRGLLPPRREGPLLLYLALERAGTGRHGW